MHARHKPKVTRSSVLCLLPLLLAKVTQSQFLNIYVSLVIPVYSISVQFLLIIQLCFTYILHKVAERKFFRIYRHLYKSEL